MEAFHGLYCDWRLIFYSGQRLKKLHCTTFDEIVDRISNKMCIKMFNDLAHVAGHRQ